MPEKKTTIRNVSKALAEISLTAFALGGDATGIPWLAALLAIPSAVLAASGPLGSQVAKLKSYKGELERLEISTPSWWESDTRSWQNVCTEIVDHLSVIFQNMWERMCKDERVKTMDVVQQVFIDDLTAWYLTWAPDSDERRKIGEVVALPILQKFGEALNLVIEQIQREEALKDQHKIAKHSALTTLRIDRELVASRIEELLRLDTENTGNQFAASDVTDTLLLALQQIVGIV